MFSVVSLRAGCTTKVTSDGPFVSGHGGCVNCHTCRCTCYTQAQCGHYFSNDAHLLGACWTDHVPSWLCNQVLQVRWRQVHWWHTLCSDGRFATWMCRALLPLWYGGSALQQCITRWVCSYHCSCLLVLAEQVKLWLSCHTVTLRLQPLGCQPSLECRCNAAPISSCTAMATALPYRYSAREVPRTHY